MSTGSAGDHYALLGIDAEADGAALRPAWRRGAPPRTPGARSGDATGAPPAAPPRSAPGVMLRRLCGPPNALLACGVARRAEDDAIELVLNAQEASEGGCLSVVGLSSKTLMTEEPATSAVSPMKWTTASPNSILSARFSRAARSKTSRICPALQGPGLQLESSIITKQKEVWRPTTEMGVRGSSKMAERL